MTGTDVDVDARPRSPAELVDEVLEVGAPIDRWSVAATLESRGVRDVDALRFGKRNVFDLAEEVYALAIARPGPLVPPPAPPLGFRPRAQVFARSYLRGAFFFLPLSIQLASLLVLGYSQWASQSFTVGQASTVALAIGLSFIATAGTTQAIGYVGPFFAAPGKHMLTERASYILLGLGLATAVAQGAFLGLLNALTGAVTWQRFAVAAVYYGLLSLLWLSTAVLYMLRQYAGMVAGTVAGIVVVGLAHGLAGLGLYVGHWVGIVASAVLNLLWAGIVLRTRARETRGTRRLALFPRHSTMVRLVAPYFIYGTLYFTFLFADRFVGWSVGDHPLPIWFRTPYELGLDWALVSVVPGMAFLEYLVTAFPVMAETEQERCDNDRIAGYNRSHLGYYLRQLRLVILLVAIGAIVSYVGIPALAELGPAGVRHGLADPVAHSVFLWGVAGYGLLTCALTNTVILLGLARPRPVIRALATALVADVIVGAVLSRHGPYWHSVLGLTSGAAVFFVLSARATVGAIREADYAYYSAY